MVGDGEELKGFRGVVGWRCWSVLLGLVGGLRLRLRRGLTLVRNREKILGTLYPLLLQQQRKKTKMQIWTEVCTRARNQGAALTRMEEPRTRVLIDVLSAVPPPLPLTELSTTLSPTPAAPSLNTPSQNHHQTRPQSPSFPSPSSRAFSEAQIVSPSTVEQGQGFSIWGMSCLFQKGKGFLGRLKAAMVAHSRLDGSVVASNNRLR